MIEIAHGKDRLTMYEDIDEMPMKNFFTMNEYALLEAEIGSSIADVNKKFQRLDILLAEGKIEEAKQERKNLHQTFWHIQQKNDFPSLQYACRIATLNKKPVKDLSLNNLKMIVNRLGAKGMTVGHVRSSNEELKKK